MIYLFVLRPAIATKLNHFLKEDVYLTTKSANEVTEVVFWWEGVEFGEEMRNVQVLAVLWLESVFLAATIERITKQRRKKM